MKTRMLILVTPVFMFVTISLYHYSIPDAQMLGSKEGIRLSKIPIPFKSGDTVLVVRPTSWDVNANNHIDSTWSIVEGERPFDEDTTLLNASFACGECDDDLTHGTLEYRLVRLL